MSGSGKGVESPLDFNECVSRDELTRLVDDRRTYMNEEFDELMHTVNSLVIWIKHVNNDLLHGSLDNNHLMVRWMGSMMCQTRSRGTAHIAYIF
jgi:hypothetical protein